MKKQLLCLSLALFSACMTGAVYAQDDDCDHSVIRRCKKTGIIKTPVPERPAGQTDLVGFRTAPMDSVRVGFIGLGMRGPGAVYRFANIDRTSVKALCDKHADKAGKTPEIP